MLNLLLAVSLHIDQTNNAAISFQYHAVQLFDILLQHNSLMFQLFLNTNLFFRQLIECGHVVSNLLLVVLCQVFNLTLISLYNTLLILFSLGNSLCDFFGTRLPALSLLQLKLIGKLFDFLCVLGS